MYTDDSFGLPSASQNQSVPFKITFVPRISPGGVFKIGFDWTQGGSISCKTMSGFISG